jgi:hypothetical protein
VRLQTRCSQPDQCQIVDRQGAHALKLCMSTFCLRNLNNYLVDLSRLQWSMCCHTPWRTMQPGEDWYNTSAMQERRHAHDNNIRHADCNHCWRLEDQNQISSRQLETQDSARLEIKISNTCDMACRYCRPNSSSIWAERMKEFGYNKRSLVADQAGDRYRTVRDEFFEWLEKELPRFQRGRGLLITGGEPFLDDDFYHLFDRININDTRIHINTNLNTPEKFWTRQMQLLNQLISQGNRIVLRCSIDGVGRQQEWQRQNSNWDIIAANWLRLGAMPIQMFCSLTVTPLTLESMCDAGQWLIDTAPMLAKKPAWIRSAMVTWPRHFDAGEWFSIFKDEIQHMQSLVTDPAVLSGEWGPAPQMRSWLASTAAPSDLTRANLRAELDLAEQAYGGGAWRQLYPKLASAIGTRGG